MAIAFVQDWPAVSINADVNEDGTSTATATAGNFLVAIIAGDAENGTGVPASSISDSKGNTWTQALYYAPVAGSPNVRIFYAANIAGGSTTITVHYENTAATLCTARIREFSGVATSSPLDQIKTANTASTTTPSTAASPTTTQADELVIVGANITGATTSVAAGSGYSNVVSTFQAGAFAALEHKIVAATGTQTGTFTLGAARVVRMALATFKAATSNNYTATPTDPVGITDSVQPVMGKVGVIVDNFDDGTIAPEWYGNYNASETGGRIRLAAAADNNYSGLPSRNHDATASGTYVTWSTLPAASTSTEVYARHMHWSSATAGTGIGFDYSKQGGVMVASAVSYVSYFDGAPVTFTMTADTTTGIEETGGTITLWRSTDGGQTKTTVRTVATPAWYTFMYAQLEGHRSADGVGDFVEFDNFNVPAGTAYTATPTDNVGLTDSVSTLYAYGQTPTDPVGITDPASVVQANSRTPADAVGITDSATAVLSLSAGMPVEQVGITDSVSTLYSFGYTATPADPVGLLDSASVVQANSRTPADAIGLTDSAARTVDAVRAPSDTIGITDSVAAVRGLTAGPVDGVSITDSVTAIITDVYAGEWQYIYVPWGTEQFTIPDLTPGMPYDLQIRAMDASGNASPWSDSEQLYGALDTVPPSTPAAPTVVSSKLALQVISTLGKASGGTYNLESDLALLEVHASSTTGFTPTTATKIGTMAADKGIMLAATPAVETFKTDATVAQYVRVIAIDKTGNRSPASATATATPGLLDSAYISELTATKISAGTLGADVIVGARIKTANAGARVELNTAGLQAFNTGGTQTVGISSADGSAFFEGTVRTGSTGARIIMQPDTGQPVVRFYPSSGTNYSFINAIDNTTSASLGMNSSAFGTSPNDYQHRTFLASSGAFLETFKPVAQTQRGGRVYTYTDGVHASYAYDGVFGGTLDIEDGIARIGTRNTGNTAWQSYVQAGNDGNIRLLGKFPNGGAQFSTSALVTGGFGVGSGFSGASISYGFTMASSMAPLYSLNGTPHFPHCVASSSATGFDIAWGPTEGTSTYTAKTIWYWVYRF